MTDSLNCKQNHQNHSCHCQPSRISLQRLRSKFTSTSMKTNALFTALAAAMVSSGLHAAENKVDFAKDIQPILEQTCIKCHGPEKQKGKLRLDSKEAAM